jgi:uncharacterized membrane protein YdjX (TVP38/TMEM64 family)
MGAAKGSDRSSLRTFLPWLVLGAAAIVLCFLLFSPAVRESIDDATRWAERIMSAHPVAGAVVFFIFSALSAMLAFASSAVLVPPANLAWGKAITFFLLWGGWLAGAIGAFGIGRLAGAHVLERLLHGENLAKYRQFTSKRVRFWMVLVFCLAIPSEIPGYLFGSAHYPFVRFIVAMGIAEAVYALGAVLAGHSLTLASPVYLLVATGTLVAVGVGAGLVLRSARIRGVARRSSTAPARRR